MTASSEHKMAEWWESFWVDYLTKEYAATAINPATRFSVGIIPADDKISRILNSNKGLMLKEKLDAPIYLIRK